MAYDFNKRNRSDSGWNQGFDTPETDLLEPETAGFQDIPTFDDSDFQWGQSHFDGEPEVPEPGPTGFQDLPAYGESSQTDIVPGSGEQMVPRNDTGKPPVRIPPVKTPPRHRTGSQGQIPWGVVLVLALVIALVVLCIVYADVIINFLMEVFSLVISVAIILAILKLIIFPGRRR